MKLLLLFCLILFYNDAFTTSQVLTRFLRHNPPPPNVTEKRITSTTSGFFEQKLDHFDSNNTKTWSQKFFVNTDFFTNDGNNVAFLMLEGEGALSDYWSTRGSIVKNAEKYGAILFLLEHRFYGESQPFSDLATENLKFLSSEQALADAAEFLQAMTEQYSLGSDVKWVSFGGSYAGSLAAWLRLTYPDLVHAAVSSSGPLHAQIDYPGYFEVVVNDLKNTNSECAANLKQGMATLDSMLANPDTSEVTVTKIFNLCNPIEQYDIDHENVSYFHLLIAYILAVAAQYNGVITPSLNDLCSSLNNETIGSEIYRIAEIVQQGFGEECVRYEYNSDVEYLKRTEISDGGRQWIYQTCTEFGWFRSTNREDKVLGTGAAVDLYIKQCVDIYGSDFNSTFIANQIDRTNADFLGTDINATRIVFTHGSYDPWHAVGLLEENNKDSPVIFIEGTSHCNDMFDEEQIDLPQLTEAREEVTRLIGEWLGHTN